MDICTLLEGRALQAVFNLLRCLHYTWLCDNMRPLYMCERFMLVEVSGRPSKGMLVCIVSMENSVWVIFVWLSVCMCLCAWAINESSNESIFFFEWMNAILVWLIVFMWKVLYTSVFSCVDEERFDSWWIKFWEHVIFLNWFEWVVFLVCHDWELIKMVCVPVPSHF